MEHENTTVSRDIIDEFYREFETYAEDNLEAHHNSDAILEMTGSELSEAWKLIDNFDVMGFLRHAIECNVIDEDELENDSYDDVIKNGIYLSRLQLIKNEKIMDILESFDDRFIEADKEWEKTNKEEQKSYKAFEQCKNLASHDKIYYRDLIDLQNLASKHGLWNEKTGFTYCYS